MAGLLLAAGPYSSEGSRIIGEKAVIGESDAVGDLLVVDGRADVKGLVKGHLYALDSDVFVRKTAAVLESLTVYGGSLHLEKGAIVPAQIEIWNADFYGDGLGRAAEGETRRLGNGASLTTRRPEEIPKNTHALTKGVMSFRRFSPRADASLESVRAWQPGLGFEQVEERSESEEVAIGGLLRLRFVSGRVQGALQRGFKGPRGVARFTAIALESPETANEFWKRVIAAKPSRTLSVSVVSEMGDGAHWYFSYRDRATTVWQWGRWVLALESRIGSGDATLLQHQQFNRQILDALRAGAVNATSEGAQP